MAPAANVSTKAMTPGAEFWNTTYPTIDATPEMTAIAVHKRMMRPLLQPPAARPELDEIASGTLEMNTAIR